jgi:hypothetical protein
MSVSQKLETAAFYDFTIFYFPEDKQEFKLPAPQINCHWIFGCDVSGWVLSSPLQ